MERVRKLYNDSGQVIQQSDLDLLDHRYGNKEYELILKEALKRVLGARYSDDSFSLDGYRECATCLQQEANKWILYNGERGNRYDLISCDTLLEACIRFFRMMSHNQLEVMQMENEFIQSLQVAA